MSIRNEKSSVVDVILEIFKVEVQCSFIVTCNIFSFTSW